MACLIQIAIKPTNNVLPICLLESIIAHLHDCSRVADTNVQHSIKRIVQKQLGHCSKIAGTILQQLLPQFFNIHWYNSSTITGTAVQQSLARVFNSYWHDCSRVASVIAQQPRQSFFLLCGHNSAILMFTVDELCACTRNTTHDDHDPKVALLHCCSQTFQKKFW